MLFLALLHFLQNDTKLKSFIHNFSNHLECYQTSYCYASIMSFTPIQLPMMHKCGSQFSTMK